MYLYLVATHLLGHPVLKTPHMSKQITTKLRGFSLDFFSFRCGQRLRVWSKHHFELKQMQQTMCRMFCVAYFSLQTNLFKHVVFLHVVRKTIEKPSAVDAMNDWSSGACVCPEAFGANRKSEKWNQRTGLRSLLDGTKVTVKFRLESQGVFICRRWHTWRVFVKSYGNYS